MCFSGLNDVSHKSIHLSIGTHSDYSVMESADICNNSQHCLQLSISYFILVTAKTTVNDNSVGRHTLGCKITWHVLIKKIACHTAMKLLKSGHSSSCEKNAFII